MSTFARFRTLGTAVAATLGLCAALLSVTPASAAQAALVLSPGCASHTLPVNDDGSTDAVALPFQVNFFGNTYNSLFVNNNGNVTFEEPQSAYTPYSIDADVPPIIAPFFADVDTRGVGAGAVTYGNVTFQGFPAFCVTWSGVGYYNRHSDKRNTFQLLLVQRPDLAAGAFDIVFNYVSIQWETGDASRGTSGFGGTSAGAGYSAGSGAAGSFYELPGSLVNGSFLDSTQTALSKRTRLSTIPGRVVFTVASAPDPGLSIDGLQHFPARGLGYQFDNAGLAGVRGWAGLSVDDVVRPTDLRRTFSDFDDVVATKFEESGLLWWHKSKEQDAIQWLSNQADGGMCYGMALTGGRLAAGLTPFKDRGLGRSDSRWSKSTAFELPKPSSSASTYSKEMTRFLANAFWAQYSTEGIDTLRRQKEAYGDVTQGFVNLRRQLVSVMKRGDDLYSSALDTPPGAYQGYAVVVFFYKVWNERKQKDDIYGHAVLAYHLEEAPNGALQMEVWNNNYPLTTAQRATPHVIRIDPAGSWTYRARLANGSLAAIPGEPLSTRTFPISGDSQGIMVLPLFDPRGLSFLPDAYSGFSTALVDLSPDADFADATDASGRRVVPVPIVGSGRQLSGWVLPMPTGEGSVQVNGAAPSVQVRADGLLMKAALAPGTGPATLTTSDDAGSIGIAGRAARLSVSRSDLMVTAEGTKTLALDPAGAVRTAGAPGTSATLTAYDARGGRVGSVELFKGKIPASGQIVLSPAKVHKALKKKYLKAKRLRVRGDRVVGGMLTALGGVFAKKQVKVKRQWFRDGAKVKGATKATYRVTKKDAGHTLTLRIVGMKRGFRDTELVSNKVVVKKAKGKGKGKR